ncbi:hypothetical protein COCSADRAFT_82931 [Bipolaris sorokiniana ND90Pr]|uniref:Trichothecene 3-O-acetyltransferase-like N-terminal domain-containing protein n=1 Tax=Cochliobolus sativus (strain ND90Pr / ATCC 201652) TaxID=665912 RepID=M2SYC3_COCSN|nr:uncharacterized protein COCSADRAFT_82931 [Bipolaris sorokiniana ND90Pr]EMD67330.1 hypothetical protein COCSADRAFT_82931 [Bipolaris sorokiniana ND90Pr]
MSENEKELNLSFLDRQSHIRIYGRYYIVFPFPDTKHANEAIDSLRMGFEEVLKRFPYLAGTINMPFIASDCLQVLFPDSIDPEEEAARVFTVNLDETANTDYHYYALERTYFSPENLPAKVFCPALIKNHPGLDDDDPYAERMTNLKRGPLPAFAAHATFIPGGLVLSVWFHHAITDGAGNARILEVWSAAVKSLNKNAQETEPSRISSEPITTHNAIDLNLARGDLDTLARGLNVEPTNPQAEKVLGRSANSLHELPYKVVTKMFRFPSSVIISLSKAMSQHTEKHISHFASLAGVVWANIIQARLPKFITIGNTKSTLAVIVDLRKHLPEPFSSYDYLGNLVVSKMPTWDLFESGNSITCQNVSIETDLEDEVEHAMLLPTISVARLQISTQNLASFITDINDAVHGVDEKWIGRKFNQILADPVQTDQSVLKFSNGPDLYVTSWQHMGADREWCMPGTVDAQPAAIRRAAWVSEGGIVVLPRKRDIEGRKPAAYEVLVSLAEEDMKGFEDSLAEGKWLVDRQ